MLYFRQLLAGRDFATNDAVARQMLNFVYAIGDTQTREVLLIDPAYDVAELVALCDADEMTIVGALGTHYHPDHVGGDMMGLSIQGARELVELRAVKVHVQRDEEPWVKHVTGLGAGDLELHDSGDVVRVGAVSVTLIHTPGHTPGSQCFLVDGKLIAGDTLFLQGCGRTDLPGGDPAEMYTSLTQRLAKVPDDTVLYPGHRYAPDSNEPLGQTRRNNPVFKPRSVDEWLRYFA